VFPSASIGGVTETDLRRHSQELGLLGKLFGSRDHAPVNIAGGIMILGILGIVFSPILPAPAGFSEADVLKALGGIVLAAFTFLGGYLGGGKRD
jgi:hypothetical protein